MAKTGQAGHMDRIIIFCAGAVASVVSEVFWKGGSRRYIALWGGMGMLLLRRLVLRFSHTSRVLLCLFGALLLMALWLSLLILEGLRGGGREGKPAQIQIDMPSFSYGLYRFLLIPPAYTIIEYLETCFRM